MSEEIIINVKIKAMVCHVAKFPSIFYEGFIACNAI